VLALRNTINKIFLDKSIKELVVSFIITTSNKKNLVVINTNPFTSNFLIEKKVIWKYLITFKLILKDKFWYKVVLYSISTLNFNILYRMKLVIDKLKTFNLNLNLKSISIFY
jgi:hypothetical protein